MDCVGLSQRALTADRYRTGVLRGLERAYTLMTERQCQLLAVISGSAFGTACMMYSQKTRSTSATLQA